MKKSFLFILIAALLILQAPVCAQDPTPVRGTELPAAGAITPDDLLFLVDDPGGTPETQKIPAGVHVVATATIAAIQAAHDAATAGDTIKLLNQTYTGTTQLNITKAITLEMQTGTVLAFTLSSGTAGIYINAASPPIRYVTIKGGTITGTGDSTRHGIYVNGGINTRLEDLSISGFSKGIYFAATSYLNTISRVTVADSASDGFYFASGGAATTTAVRHCYSNRAGGNGYSFNGGHYNSLIGCAVDNSTGYGYYFSNTTASLIGSGAESNAKPAIYALNNSKLNIINFTSVDNNDSSTSYGNVIHATGGGWIDIDGLFEYSATSTYGFSFVIDGTVVSNIKNTFLQKSIYTGSTNPWNRLTYPLWIDGDNATYASTTQCTVSGDVTTKYTAGTLVRALVADGTKAFSRVNSSSYSAPNTTININNAILLNYASLHLEYSQPEHFIEQVGTLKRTYGTAPPTVGTWAVGDERVNTSMAAGGTDRWRCTTAGTPGTWTSLTLN